MSHAAILTAIPKYLIARLDDWNVDNCKAMVDGQPEAIMGTLFASVHIEQMQTILKTTDGLHEELWTVSVTVTKKIEAVPSKQIPDSIYLKHLEGIAPIVSRIKHALHNRWTVTTAVNAEFTASPDEELDQFITERCFISPMYCITVSPKPKMQNEEWFHGHHGLPLRDRHDGPVGLSMSLTFGHFKFQAKLANDDC